MAVTVTGLSKGYYRINVLGAISMADDHLYLSESELDELYEALREHYGYYQDSGPWQRRSTGPQEDA